MAGSGGDTVILGLRGEVMQPYDGLICDTDPTSSHANHNGSRCENSAMLLGANSNCKCKTRQGKHHVHGPCRRSSLFPLAQLWTFGHRPIANSVHNSLSYFIIIVLMLSQSLQVLAEPYSRTPENVSPVRGEDVILRCGSTDPNQTIIWQKGPVLVFIGPAIYPGTPARFSLENTSDLKITGVTSDDSGTYSCTLPSTTSVYANVTVLVPPGQPVITPDTSSSVLTEGDTLTLTCSSSGGNPSPALVWKRNGQTITAGPTVPGMNAAVPTKSELTIQLQKAYHQATYKCEASNGVGDSVSESRTLQIRYSPRISFSPYNPYNTILGQSVNLTCEADAYPTQGMTYTWEKDGVQRPQRSNFLWFPSIEKTDNGTYTCTVFNGVGQAKSESVVMKVQYAPEIMDFPDRVIVNESDPVNISCQSDAYPLPSDTTWTSSRGNTQYTSQLLFTPVSRMDSDNYTCTVTNILRPSNQADGVPSPRSKTLELLVQYPPGTPEFVSLNSPNVGDRIELKCLLPNPGYPAGSVEWQKEGTSEISTAEVYVIPTASLSDSGKYKCRGRNLLGAGVWVTMQLIVNEPARFITTLPATKNVNITEPNFQLECKARGRPQPDIQWRKNGVPFDHGGDGDFFEITASPVETVDTYSYIVTSTLKFKGFKRLHQIDGREDLLMMADTGNYTCAAGSDSQTIQIFVQYAPVVTVTPPKVAQNPNTTVAFTCVAKANPEPLFQWHFNEVAINSLGKYRIQSGLRGSQDYEYTSVLTVGDIAESDKGQYKCTATNMQGANFQTGAIVDKATPDASTELEIVGRTWNSVFLEWKPGFDGGHVQSFIVQCSNDDHTQSVEADKPAVNITGLYPSTWYMITVIGMNSLGSGPQSSPINTTTKAYNFTIPTAVKFDRASNTLSFEEPPAGYFAKVEVLLSNQNDWIVSEDKANTKGGSIKLKESNIKKCRVSFCVEGTPHVCSEPVEAPQVGEPATTAGGDLSTVDVVIIACVCALIIIALCIALFCVIRKRRQDKAAKDYELETQANRRSQPINNPKDIAPKRGYDNPDFSSHQIQRNGHVASAPIANGKLNHPYKPPMNTDNSFESGDMHKFDEYDHHTHQSDPHYYYDGPRGDYIERPPSHLKDPSVSGQESGYSTPEPTKPKKVIYEVVV